MLLAPTRRVWKVAARYPIIQRPSKQIAVTTTCFWVSVVRFSSICCVMHSPHCQRLPTLASILSDTAPPPWTLDKFVDHLVANHCLETLEFIHYSSIYRECYEQVACTTPSRSTLTPEHEHLRSLWVDLIDAYIAPNGKREVNLPFDVKTRLLATRQSDNPPHPLMLDSAVSLVYDLIENSVMVSFLISPIPPKPPEAGGTGRWDGRQIWVEVVVERSKEVEAPVGITRPVGTGIGKVEKGILTINVNLNKVDTVLQY